jgi:hypothetical protein
LLACRRKHEGRNLFGLGDRRCSLGRSGRRRQPLSVVASAPNTHQQDPYLEPIQVLWEIPVLANSTRSRTYKQEVTVSNQGDRSHGERKDDGTGDLPLSVGKGCVLTDTSSRPEATSSRGGFDCIADRTVICELRPIPTRLGTWGLARHSQPVTWPSAVANPRQVSTGS